MMLSHETTIVTFLIISLKSEWKHWTHYIIIFFKEHTFSNNTYLSNIWYCNLVSTKELNKQFWVSMHDIYFFTYYVPCFSDIISLKLKDYYYKLQKCCIVTCEVTIAWNWKSYCTWNWNFMFDFTFSCCCFPEALTFAFLCTFIILWIKILHC